MTLEHAIIKFIDFQLFSAATCKTCRVSCSTIQNYCKILLTAASSFRKRKHSFCSGKTKQKTLLYALPPAKPAVCCGWPQFMVSAGFVEILFKLFVFPFLVS